MKEFFEQNELIELLSELNPVIDRSEKNLIINCPSCGERECSVSIEKEGHVWGCFRMKECGDRGNIWKILQVLGKLEKLLFKGAKNDVDFIDINNLSLTRHEHENILPDLHEDIDILPPFGWKRLLSGNAYLDERGFRSYKYSDVGVTELETKLKDYIIFLVKENNKIKGYVGRHIWDKEKIEKYNEDYFIKTGFKNKIKRYSNSTGTNFSNLLYGYDEINEVKPVCLVEGIFDKHAIDEKLLLNENRFMYTLATFKCFISISQIIKLKIKGIKDIILFYDPDVINAIKRNIRELSNYFNVKVIISDINKDPDEMTQDELLFTIDQRIFNSNDVFDNFIQLKKLK